MANIKNELNNIKSAIYGKDVRESIYDGMYEMNKELEKTTGKQVDLENTFNQLVINAGNSNSEIVDARVKSDGTSYSKLGDRLDAVDLQLENEALHIQNITTEKFRDEQTNTTYYITEIKRVDIDGEIIKPKLGIANDSYNNGILETCRSFAKRHNATAVFNGGFFSMETNTINTLFIKDGIILNNGETVNSNTNRILVWNDEGFLNQVDTRYSASEILAMGYTNALCGAVCLLDKGKPVTTGNTSFHPRQVVAQRENGDIIFLTCDGRTDTELGMGYNDLIRILQTYNVSFAYSLDGGGSVSSVVNGVKINKNIDDNGYTDRPIANFIYFEKEKKVNKTTDITNIHSMIGDLDQHIKKVVLDLFNIKDINSGELNLYGNDNNSGNSIIKSFDNNGNHIHNFTFRADGTVRCYDMINNRTMFEVNSEGRIYTPKGAIGNFIEGIKTVSLSELDNVSISGIYYVLYDSSSTKNINQGVSISYSVIHFNIGSNHKMQVAFPFDTSSIIRSSRIRRTNGDSWTEWQDLINPSEVRGGQMKLHCTNDSFAFTPINNGTLLGNFSFRPDRLYYYDLVNNRTMFRVDTDGTIQSAKGVLGMFNKTPKTVNISDIDNINETGIYWVSGASSIGGRNISYGILNFYISDTAKMQIAYPYDEIGDMPARIRRISGGSWTAWRDL